MTEHNFGLIRGKLPEAHCERLDAIARKHGGTFLWWYDEGDEDHRACFVFPDDPSPIRQATERSVWEELEREGLADAKGLIRPHGG